MDATGSVLLVALAAGCLITGLALEAGAPGDGGAGAVLVVIGAAAAVCAALLGLRHRWHVRRHRRPSPPRPHR